jgi:hypothetical protein
MLIALGVGLASAAWQVPEWLDDLGTWISIAFLTLLGLLNLRAVLTAPGRRHGGAARHQGRPAAAACKRPHTRWRSPPSAPCSRCPSTP